MKIYFAAGIIACMITSSLYSQSIFPADTEEYCPQQDIIFTVRLPVISTGTIPNIVSWTNNPIVVSNINPATIQYYPDHTICYFTGRFRDLNIKQVFKINYSVSGNPNASFDFEFKRIKSLYYTIGCSGAANQPAVTVPRCQIVSIPLSIPPVRWGTSFETPELCFGTITNFEYQLPVGWSLAGQVSTGANWLAGGNNVTVTSDISNGVNGAILVRPRNICGSGLQNNQVPAQIPISRPAPPLLLTSTAEQICNVGENTSFTVSGLPAGATVNWTISDPTVASLSSSSGPTVTVTKTAAVNSFLTVNATVTHCVFTYPLSKQIALGTGRTTVFFSNKQVSCEAGGRPYFNGAVEGFTSATNFEWYAKDMSNNANPFVLKDNGSATGDFPFTRGNRYYTIRVKAFTPCGAVQTLDSDGLIWVPDCNSAVEALQVSPNPAAADIVSVSLPDGGTASRTSPAVIRQLLLCDHSGNVLTSIPAAGKSVLFSVRNLQPGLYIIKATDGVRWWSAKLMRP